ncbi:PD-(D/E)XK motif protein [Thalassospira marina]|uniref:PD-(D/E)XK motif protein n=1 Tax=Thalassospira marina TaxID=2048283 RepID=A0ABN5FLF1_9PROT|nr:PD-(D/E)XK motif protein [Thalassospira marina]AUG55278.1 hypothetical protein CSC3H3_20565 [Thalassospira marina]
MALQSEFDRLQTAWRALASDGVTEGWRTIPIELLGPQRLLAGRHFPGNEEAVLVGFNSVRLPLEGQLPQGQGFRVERIKHKISDVSHTWIALSRQPVGSLDMFARMAEDVVGMLEVYRHVEDQVLFQLFLGRIKAWQEFMHQARAEVLGPEAETGLAGELCFLKSLLETGLPATTVLDGWHGPLNGLHDFLFGLGAIEVKSTVATLGFPATIGSLEQLDASLVTPLFLAGVRLVLDPGGMTLPAIIDDILRELEDKPEARGKFESLVLRTGFLRAFSDRYRRRFALADIRILLIDGAFPALTRNNVNPVIRKVRYELDLDLVSASDVGMDCAFEQLGVLNNGTR